MVCAARFLCREGKGRAEVSERLREGFGEASARVCVFNLFLYIRRVHGAAGRRCAGREKTIGGLFGFSNIFNYLCIDGIRQNAVRRDLIFLFGSKAVTVYQSGGDIRHICLCTACGSEGKGVREAAVKFN